MSDATHPDMNPSPSPFDDSLQPEAQLNSIPFGNSPHTSDGEWQTVNFPGALDVDAIPMEAAIVHPVPDAAQIAVSYSKSQQEDDRDSLIHQLQQENTTLREQVTNLEEDLSQLQIELQLEVARFYCKQEEVTDETESSDQTQALNAAELQIQQLTHDLHTSQQTIRHQQVEIEALSLKLAESQQRLAQLERDCVLSQQRYKEQLQLVSQAEDTCQDLRMRLHRQQQQTLQFKAALEKSIEMNAVLETMQSESTAANLEVGNQGDTDATAFMLKAKPVQPWSTAPGGASPSHSSTKQHASGLPSLLAKLSKQTPVIDSSRPHPRLETSDPLVEPEALDGPPESTQAVPPIDEASKNILEFLFPTQSTPTITEATTAQDAIFDLSPFIEAGAVDSETITGSQAVEPVEVVVYQPEPTAETPPPSQPVPSQPQDMLWADLARLIEPDLIQEDTTVESHPFGNAEGISIQLIPQNPVNNEEQVVEFLQPIDLVSLSSEQMAADETSVLQEPPAIASHHPFPSFTLRQTNDPEADQRESVVEGNPRGTSDSPVPSGFPSPILYPTRQPKKIPSMAAVDLPSFPRG